jgi:TolB-like protein
MNKTWLSVLLLSLSGCAQLCDCDNAKTEPAEANVATASEPAASSGPAIGSDGYVLEDKPMAEAAPAGTIQRQSQLDLVAQDPTARPFLPVAPAPSRLTRKMLPSEFPVAVEGQMMPPSAYPNFQHSKKQLSDYASQLGFKLAAFDVLKGAKVGVASFVEFDESLQQSNALGNQFAEAMATTLPQHGVEVIDFKLTRKITVSREGDFALSRDVRQLSDKAGMDFILVGTLVTTKRGVQVNSRIVSVKGQQVVAAASTLLPHLVLQQIQP